jgi:hypothetical protein
MQAQVKQKASDEILSDCQTVTIFSHSTKEGGLPQNGVEGRVSALNVKPDTEGQLYLTIFHILVRVL